MWKKLSWPAAAGWPRWQTWRAADWGVLLRCLWLIPAVEFSVRWRAPRRWLPSESAAAALLMSNSAATAARAAEFARWVDAAYRRSPFTSTCLTRSLVLHRLLRGRGIPCRVQIGVRREAGDFKGHAWVELAGTPLNDGNDVHRHFAAFDYLPAGLLPDSKEKKPNGPPRRVLYGDLSRRTRGTAGPARDGGA